MRIVIENVREGLSTQTDEAGLVRLPSDNAAHFFIVFSGTALFPLARYACQMTHFAHGLISLWRKIEKATETLVLIDSLCIICLL